MGSCVPLLSKAGKHQARPTAFYCPLPAPPSTQQRNISSTAAEIQHGRGPAAPAAAGYLQRQPLEQYQRLLLPFLVEAGEGRLPRLHAPGRRAHQAAYMPRRDGVERGRGAGRQQKGPGAASGPYARSHEPTRPTPTAPNPVPTRHHGPTDPQHLRSPAPLLAHQPSTDPPTGTCPQATQTPHLRGPAPPER